MLSMEDWAGIRRLHRAEVVPIKEIARLMGLARNTERTAVRADEAPSYKRKARGSGVDAHEPAIRRLLGVPPVCRASRARRPGAGLALGRRRWLPSASDGPARARSSARVWPNCDRSTCRLTHASAPTTAPVNWPVGPVVPEPRIPLDHGQEAVLPVIVGVSGYSRMLVAQMIPTRRVHNILLGHLACLLVLGGVRPVQGSFTWSSSGLGGGGNDLAVVAFR